MTVNDTLIFSKLKLGGFPDLQRVVEEVRKASEGQSMEVILEAQASSCAIL